MLEIIAKVGITRSPLTELIPKIRTRVPMLIKTPKKFFLIRKYEASKGTKILDNQEAKYDSPNPNNTFSL